jgi:hypothetical protein
MQMSERLAKLVLLLSSSNDGEVVAAARAVGRCLREMDKDWHDLANAARRVGGARATTQSFDFSHFSWGGVNPAPARGGMPDQDFGFEVGDRVAPANVRQACKRLVMEVHRMSQKEREFVWEMERRVDTYGDTALMSKSQQVWIMTLRAKYVK